jgi:hypothetical protein
LFSAYHLRLSFRALSGFVGVTRASRAGRRAVRGAQNPLESLEIETDGEIDLRGFLGIRNRSRSAARLRKLSYIVRIKGSGTKEQFAEVHEAVMTTSPLQRVPARGPQADPRRRVIDVQTGERLPTSVASPFASTMGAAAVAAVRRTPRHPEQAHLARQLQHPHEQRFQMLDARPPDRGDPVQPQACRAAAADRR